MTPRDVTRPVVLGGALVPLLRRMRREFDEQGRFGRRTAAVVWTAYAAGTIAFADALRGRRVTPVTAAAAALPAGAGAAMLAAGVGAFDGAQQVTGTQAGPLITGGVYRYGRNPQYAGIVLVAAAAAVATLSPGAAGIAVMLAGAYRWWVPVEERALAREFGDAYRQYVTTTPRWLGRPRA